MQQNRKTDDQIEINSDYKIVSIKSRIVKFGIFYANLPVVSRYGIIFICSIFAGLLNAIMIKNTGVYLSGIAGITNAISRIIYAKTSNQGLYDGLYWSLVIIVNVPLIILSYYKIDKTFTYLTVTYLVTTYVSGYLISLIPSLNAVFIFGKSLAIPGDFVTSWTAINNAPFILLCYAVIFALFNGIMFSFMYIVGGSSAGLDFLVFYISKRKNKSITSIMLFWNLTTLFLSTVIGSYIANWQSDKSSVFSSDGSKTAVDLFFSPNLVFSLFGAFVQTMVIGHTFPRDKKAQVAIYSAKNEAIAKALIDNKYQHAFTKTTVTGGFTNNSYEMIQTICLYPETLKLTDMVLKVDPKAFITYSSISGITGSFSTKR